jgi:hypothetical protein
LWFVLTGRTGQLLAPDPHEIRAALVDQSPDRPRRSRVFDPHLNRMLAKFDQLRTTGDGA